MPHPLKQSTIKITVSKGGRLVIPAEYRHQLGIKTGDELLLTLAEGQIHLQTIPHAIQNAQKIVRQFSADRTLSSELLQERRQESEHG